MMIWTGTLTFSRTDPRTTRMQVAREKHESITLIIGAIIFVARVIRAEEVLHNLVQFSLLAMEV